MVPSLSEILAKTGIRQTEDETNRSKIRILWDVGEIFRLRFRTCLSQTERDFF